MSDPDVHVDAFLCPAHVSAVIGSLAYEPVTEAYGVPCVIAGFEPLDILLGLKGILEQAVKGETRVDNQYSRVVRPEDFVWTPMCRQVALWSSCIPAISTGRLRRFVKRAAGSSRSHSCFPEVAVSSSTIQAVTNWRFGPKNDSKKSSFRGETWDWTNF